jgi:lipoprotein-anchoring transpeptidase ErfK/SrfK
MKDLTKIVVAGVSTAALAGGIGAGLAYASTTSDKPTTSPSASATSSPAGTPTAEPTEGRDRNNARKPFVRRQLQFVARALHGEVTLAGEEHRVIAFQRGQVRNVGQTSVTVKSNDGFVETYALSGDTKVRENGEEAKISDIDTSDRVLVVALKDDSTLNARRVIVRDG